jgi:transaldolase / glucose-6-phosphate isomerase
VNTMPEATLDAFRDHGTVRPLAATEDVDKADSVLALLRDESIDLDEITSRLIEEGIATFVTDFDTLMSRIQAKTKEVLSIRPKALVAPPALEERVERRLDSLEADDIVERIWRGDHTVWNPVPTEIADRLGWLHVPEPMREQVGPLRAFADQAAADGFTEAVVLGMGGSSLAPEVVANTLDGASGMLRLTVLDTTHPGAVAALQDAVDLSRTLFVVASKSGTTVETLSHFAYFHNEVGAGDQFVAITDRGTPLEKLAQEHGFRALFLNPSDIGGRYSALSLFGLVPAALVGVDLDAMLEGAQEMAAASARCVPCRDNPGAWLGAVIGEAALAGHDKLTLVSSDAMENVGPWIEQLVAESTGKKGKGILPVVGEVIGQPDVYGPDRLFVVLGDAGSASDELEAAGHPVVHLAAARERLGAEFFRWEVATAVAGHVLGINPFDQPDVAAAKEATKRVLDSPDLEAPDSGDVHELLRDLAPGDYVTIQAFLHPRSEVERVLDKVRIAIRDRHRVATTVGFGPRYLHSTGQLHKGGPGNGAFIQVVDDRRDADVPIPDAPYTFGSLIDAQATGDLLALRDRGRRAVRVTLDRLMEVA